MSKKYKKMKMQGKNQGLNLIAGGFLYPMDSFELSKCHSNDWFVKDTYFIVDGIDLSNLE